MRRDAMPNGGRLSVKTYNFSKEQSQAGRHKLPEAEYVVCEVADTGTGIPKDILEKIWEPFFSTKEVGKGTGLGLSMVYGIVKQTGGFIYCDSEEGKGTTFTIYLPRHYPQVPAEPAVPAEKVEAPRADLTGRGRILVVEDEDSVRAFAVRALTSRGYTVVEADSGERGPRGDRRGQGRIRSHSLRRGHAGNGWPHHALGNPQARHHQQVHLHVGLCRGCLRAQSREPG
jgi:two-component system cell cycle sensor histidine kinase/response regulator CckA